MVYRYVMMLGNGTFCWLVIDFFSSMARMALTLEIADLGQLSRLLDKVLRLPNVVAAQRKR